GSTGLVGPTESVPAGAAGAGPVGPAGDLGTGWASVVTSTLVRGGSAGVTVETVPPGGAAEAQPVKTNVPSSQRADRARLIEAGPVSASGSRGRGRGRPRARAAAFAARGGRPPRARPAWASRGRAAAPPPAPRAG